MIARFLKLVGKGPNHFNGNWGGQAAKDFDPRRNRSELLRFAGLLLSDAEAKQVTADEILNCVSLELNVHVSDADRDPFLACLLNHPSFKRVAENLFELV